ATYDNKVHQAIKLLLIFNLQGLFKIGKDCIPEGKSILNAFNRDSFLLNFCISVKVCRRAHRYNEVIILQKSDRCLQYLLVSVYAQRCSHPKIEVRLIVKNLSKRV